MRVTGAGVAGDVRRCLLLFGTMLETADVRKRLMHRLGELRKASGQRRALADAARAAFESVMDREIAPTVRQFAQALKAEGLAFSVQTPSASVRLVSDRSSDNAIEIALDLTGRQPTVYARSSYTRGRRDLQDERVLAEGEAIGALDAERVLAALLDLVEPFVER
ncbi:MAG: hypothetical protein H0V80_06205 [Acidobacteria bacterium]|nr:hypothetical protein [Acidobacteriota bacterium]